MFQIATSKKGKVIFGGSLDLAGNELAEQHRKDSN
jgi:hypothetical protein